MGALKERVRNSHLSYSKYPSERKRQALWSTDKINESFNKTLLDWIDPLQWPLLWYNKSRIINISQLICLKFSIEKIYYFSPKIIFPFQPILSIFFTRLRISIDITNLGLLIITDHINSWDSFLACLLMEFIFY